MKGNRVRVAEHVAGPTEFHVMCDAQGLLYPPAPHKLRYGDSEGEGPEREPTGRSGGGDLEGQ